MYFRQAETLFLQLTLLAIEIGKVFLPFPHAPTSESSRIYIAFFTCAPAELHKTWQRKRLAININRRARLLTSSSMSIVSWRELAHVTRTLQSGCLCICFTLLSFTMELKKHLTEIYQTVFASFTTAFYVSFRTNHAAVTCAIKADSLINLFKTLHEFIEKCLKPNEDFFDKYTALVTNICIPIKKPFHWGCMLRICQEEKLFLSKNGSRNIIILCH